MQDESKIEGLTLKKLRELKSLTRKETGVILDVSFKTIEKYENGRTPFSKSKLDKILHAYGFSYDDFCLCRDGKLQLLKKGLGYKTSKVIEHNNLRRSYQKVVSKEAKVLQVMRTLKGLTQYKASHFCGYHRTAIGHIENGRIDLTKKKIYHIIENYRFTLGDFNHHMNAEVFVTDIQNDCIKILKSLSEEKLKAVYPLLSTFKN